MNAAQQFAPATEEGILSGIHSTLPEPVTADLAAYQIQLRLSVLDNLKALIAQQSPVTLYFKRDTHFVVTHLLDISPQGDSLIFDQGGDASANHQLLQATDITAVTFLDHIKLQFTADRVENISYQQKPAFRIPVPKSLLRLQRRDAYRARTPLVRSPMLMLPTEMVAEPERALRVRVVDISCTGLAFVALAEQPPLADGMELHKCRLYLELEDPIDLDMQIRHLCAYKDGFGRQMLRAGCFMSRLGHGAEMSIQRYINYLEVQKRRLL
ncbi:MAG: flagellar brake protein [Betaproteobacteria bacterium]|nr:flagellar brake protein [Betaproteobacteria bacterium]